MGHLNRCFQLIASALSFVFLPACGAYGETAEGLQPAWGDGGAPDESSRLDSGLDSSAVLLPDAPEASCSSVVGCGGDIKGTWVAASSCLSVTGVVDLRSLGLGCSESPTSGNLSISGNWTFRADGTTLDETTTAGTQTIALRDECLEVAITGATCDGVGRGLAGLGFHRVACESDQETGHCDCSAAVNQAAGAALISRQAIKMGNYTTAMNVLTVTDGQQETRYAYCVEEDTLFLTPQTATAVGTVDGTIVFVRD